MSGERRPPIEPGPEPDTTDAAIPFDEGSTPAPEDEPAMVDEAGDEVESG